VVGLDLIRINDVVNSFSISSRTLRYYEEVGLIREWVKGSSDFQLDNERPEMLEEILPWDLVKKLDRWQQDIFIPIK
jgi:hypothetical protein